MNTKDKNPRRRKVSPMPGAEPPAPQRSWGEAPHSAQEGGQTDAQAALRRQAEALARDDSAPPGYLESLSRDEAERMLHELRVHQIELEMQNEELRRAQVELDLLRSRYFDLYDLAPVGYCSLGETGLIEEANLTAARLLGVGRGALVKQPLSRFIDREDQDIYYLRRKELMTNGEPQAFELRMLTNGHEPFWAHLVATTEADNPGACRVVISDVSARKQAEAARAHIEAQLQESQKMESLGTLAGGIAHDFNNALAVIMGNVELARLDLEPGHAVLESIEEIANTGRRACDMVQQILAFRRRESLSRKPTSLSLVVLESARLLRAALPAGITLKVECAADTPAVLADATQVKQILLNLCGNALQAVQDAARPGAIEVRLDASSPQQGQEPVQEPAQADAGGAPSHARGAGRYACLSVHDNGLGMDATTRARIFEPFFNTKPMGKGIGLGLSVVHGILRTHQGTMEVQRTPGEGSTFRVYFPASEEAVEEVPASTADTAKPHGNGKHLLYVDDEKALVSLMTRMLTRQGYRVSGYTDPLEALAAVRSNPGLFDLVVSDYNMPGMSGLELARALKALRPDLPVVLASGYITDELCAQAPAAGVSELIYKPNTVEALCAAVARAATGPATGPG